MQLNFIKASLVFIIKKSVFKIFIIKLIYDILTLLEKNLNIQKLVSI